MFLLISGRDIWWGGVVLIVSIALGVDPIRTGFQRKQEDSTYQRCGFDDAVQAACVSTMT
jgi:hypothetical protein